MFCLLIIIVWIIPCESAAQCPGNVVLQNQNDVDSFNINYDCSRIDGYLYIGNGDITNLDSLYKIDSVMDKFAIIGNDSLVSISGLSNLVFVGDDTDINENQKLKTLTGLEGLLRISEDFRIKENDSLCDISMLDSLITIGGDLTIVDNQNLNTCNTYWVCNLIACGVDAIVGHNGEDCNSENVGLLDCGCVTGLDISLEVSLSRQVDLDKMAMAFANCPFEISDLEIFGEGIKNLDSLIFLEEIQGQLRINQTDSLLSLNGLQNLRLLDELDIQNNQQLEDISMIDPDIMISRELTISSNDSLSDCAVEWLCKVIDCLPDEYIIDGNNTGCQEKF